VDDEALKQELETQISRLWEILTKLGMDEVSDLKLSEALSFAETLVLCPSESSVSSHMQRDQRAIQSFLRISEVVANDIGTGNTKFVNPPGPEQTPFYLVASSVQEWLLSRKTLFPELWQ
jgi:hypothetical protein